MHLHEISCIEDLYLINDTVHIIPCTGITKVVSLTNMTQEKLKMNRNGVITPLNEHVFNIPKNYFAVPRNQRVGVEQTLQEVQWFPDLAVRV